ncbi:MULTISPECIES: hypothetical protein [unclassified Streptomyces]|uniref:hypothetical protein n=1 Tax=unclassified Streptomyces TaxID=2593676 RepID=UPI00093AB68B|nr:hypothetical protein [Streptomyces sp. TSRI0107]OKJ88476.1 hypothetical protein AMK31_08305 [Streptomyces sp. TSRI0107]
MHHLLCGLAANPALPGALIDRLIGLADDDVDSALACRADLGRARAVALSRRDAAIAVRLAYSGGLTAADVDPVARPGAALALLDEGAGSAQWARRFAADPVVEHREKLAACTGLPPDVTDALAADPETRVVTELALWTTSSDVAARLAGHPHAEVRSAVAANEATPSAVLGALVTGDVLPPARWCLVCDREATPFAHDPHCDRPGCELPSGAACDGGHESTVHGMYERALRNPATPAAAVVGFAEHPSPVLRSLLAARPDLPPPVYRRLAHDSSPAVRAELAENPAIDEALIRALAEDPGHDVRRRLAHHPRVPLDVLAELADATRIGPTSLPRVVAASPSEVEELAASPNPTLRMFVAARRDLPPEIRDALAEDPDAKVLASIAAHPGLSESRLRAMTGRHGARVIARVAANPDASPALLHDLARHRPPVPKALREIARHPAAPASALLACLADPRARPVAAAHPALPPQVVVDLLTDDDEQVAEAAAANRALPAAEMARLVSLADAGAGAF